MITGTCHFVSFSAAVKYYRAYGYSRQEVASKRAAGEIVIGAPSIKPGERLKVDESEGRYFIVGDALRVRS